MADSALTGRALALALSFAVGCGGAAAEGGRGTLAPSPSGASAPAAAGFAVEDASWGRFHSKRFNLSVPLPDGKAWKIDDHRRPGLVASHPATGSSLELIVTRETELVGRAGCEARARDRGWVPEGLTTLEDHVQTGPDAYDSRVWVALEPGEPGATLEGHVFLFGGFLRQCLLVHFRTRVPSLGDEGALSERLALARTRIVGGLALDPPRVSDDADVPRVRPDIRR